ncbi:MAG TPA: hypothetical protein VHU80_08825 [Polyangiaceae bacterium]|nr:hypothetical protein [Polyangiaceae bacterium]
MAWVGAALFGSAACTRRERVNAVPPATATANPSPPARNAALIDALRSSKLADVERAFDDRLRAAVPEARLAAVWKEATSDKGAFVDVHRVRHFETGAGEAELSTLRFERGFVDVRITQPRSQSDPFHQKW